MFALPFHKAFWREFFWMSFLSVDTNYNAIFAHQCCHKKVSKTEESPKRKYAFA